MSNYMGKVELAASGSPQILTASYVAFGDVCSFAGANQGWLRLKYVGGSEATGLDIVIRYLKTPIATDAYKDPVLSDLGGSYQLVERAMLIAKADEGFWDIPIASNGRKYFEVYVKADGALGGSPGSVYGDVEFYRV